MDDIKWHLFCDVTGIYLWVDQRLPLIIAASVVGRQFDQIVEFAPPNIEIDKAAVIIGAESRPSGTTFHLSFPLTDRSRGSSPNDWYSAGDSQC